MHDEASAQPLSTPALTRWLWLAAPLPIVLAGYWGYRSAADRWPVMSLAAPAQAASAGGAGNSRASPANAPAAAPMVKSKARPDSSKPPEPRNGLPVPGALASTSSNTPATWPLWEFQLKQPLPPQNPPLTPPNWRLVGSSNDGKKWQLVILRQGKAEPEFYTVGQELPGKYKIEAITGEDVTLVQRGRRMVLSYIGY